MRGGTRPLRLRVSALWPLAGLVLALVVVSQPAASANGRRKAVEQVTAKTHTARPHALESTVASGGGDAIPDYNWFPGYYVLNFKDTGQAKRAILADPLVKPFTGVQFRYHWDASESSSGDYSAGFAAVDTDLKSVAAKKKKLLVMLTYKKFDGTSSVPADLRTGPGPWCTGSYCGELTNGSGTSQALVWNPVVEARLKAWITAMARHLSQSPYIGSVAGIVLNETALGTTDPAALTSAGYNANAYIAALEDLMHAATTAAPRLITILYFEGGFVNLDGSPVNAGQKIGDWLLKNPRTGIGTPDLRPKDPKSTNHPCAHPEYQVHIACAPAVQRPDYSTQVTDSFDDTFRYATEPSPNGLHASFLTFAYGVGPGADNAFTFADASHEIPSHPIPNTARPWPVVRPAAVVKKIAMTTPIRAGKTASLTIAVSPPARCSVHVAKVKGLQPKRGGKITWRWRVTTPPGQWPVSVRCDNRATLRATMRVRPR